MGMWDHSWGEQDPHITQLWALAAFTKVDSIWRQNPPSKKTLYLFSSDFTSLFFSWFSSTVHGPQPLLAFWAYCQDHTLTGVLSLPDGSISSPLICSLSPAATHPNDPNLTLQSLAVTFWWKVHERHLLPSCQQPYFQQWVPRATAQVLAAQHQTLACWGERCVWVWASSPLWKPKGPATFLLTSGSWVRYQAWPVRCSSLEPWTLKEVT